MIRYIFGPTYSTCLAGRGLHKRTCTRKTKRGESKILANYFLSSDQNQTFLVSWVQVPIEQPLFSYWLELSVMGGLVYSFFLRFSHGRRKQALTPFKEHLLWAWFITVLPLHYWQSFITFYDVIENKVLFQNANSSVSLFALRSILPTISQLSHGSNSWLTYYINYCG